MPLLPTSTAYARELRLLQERLVLMASLVEELVRHGLEALRAGDAELAARSIELDRRIDGLECEVDALCMRILAMRQPVATDLRFVTSSLKIVTDLERVGDLGVNLCERVIELADERVRERRHTVEGPLRDELSSLADESMAALRDALDALVERDARLFRLLLAEMARDPGAVYLATRVQSVAKYLERIADHAMNVAEAVVFLVKGKDIRHFEGIRP
jgi:phosphate transport system protein